MNEIEVVLARADVADANGDVLTEAAVRSMADGVRLFWDEAHKALVYRGPADGLPYEPAIQP